MQSYRSIRDLPGKKRTRLAPTPSGFLHLGNILSFAITAHFARKTGADILLRIDDLDRKRTKRTYLKDIFETLQFLDIPWDEGPRTVEEFESKWSQYSRLKKYEAALEELASAGKVFACECSRTKIAALSPDGQYTGICINKKLDLSSPHAQWRLLTRPAKVLRVSRLGSSELKGTLPVHMQYFVVRRKDGIPAYQLASLIDDMEFGVDLIIRGTDLWPSSWAQVYLADVLGYDSFSRAHFLHHPLLLMQNGEKLSKSAGSASIRFLRHGGADKESIYQLIAQLLGSMERCRSWTDLGRIAEKSFAP